MTKSHDKSSPANVAGLGPSAKQRMADGKKLRERVPRSSQAEWKPAPNRPDPLQLLKRADRGRLEALLPIRYARMKQSPFGFFRGSAALMAADLSTTPSTGLRVQACGDCHIANFGGFGSPERRLVFDINDFDETLPAPWEWDVKRLAASTVLAGRELGVGDKRCSSAARTMVRSYREHMREYAEMRALEVWYSHLDAEIFIDEAHTAAARKRWSEIEKNATLQTAEHVFPKITAVKNGRLRILDRPPLVYHPPDIAGISAHVREMFERYRRTLPEERRVVLQRYHVVDIARKVVGIGSVGTRCDVALLMAGANDPLFLQFKQANESVLAPYAGKSRYSNQGERVVTGQRMLQSASDVFLGWARGDDGCDYYFRQLRDMRMKFDVSQMPSDDWLEFVKICGWTLARAHARTGDPAKIAGYLGKGETFDRAIGAFAVAYADQTERDHALLVKAIRAGKLHAAHIEAAS
ncbi:MAG TPA: DUF2252 domain-containing protein [Candidatus Acidoferrum sp.]|nr:DUF2252 domain-containing protein [Candidatus Acidoferrum sp.]